MGLRRLLTSRLQPYRGPLMVIVVLQGLQAIAGLILPELSAELIDDGVLTGNTALIWDVGLVMLIFGAIQVVLAVAATYVGARVAMGFSRDVRRDLFERVTEFSEREVGHFGPASLITRITNDVQQVQQLVVLTATMMIAAPLTLTFGVIMAIRVDVGLSVVMVVAIPIAVVVLGVLVAMMVPSFQAMQERIDRINAVLREQITGVRVVRAFVREPVEIERFAEANQQVTQVSLRAGRLMGLIIPLINVVVYCANIAVLAVGANRVIDGSLNIGSLFAYISYLMLVLMSVVMTTFVASMVPRASVAGERIMEVLDTHSTVNPPEHPVRDLVTPGTVEMVGAGFQYPGAEQPVLCDVTFTNRPGQTTAIIGGTGSGKTTLVNLILRLFDATEGEVKVHGVDVAQLDPEVLSRSTGYVPQRAFLFSGTVASNLRYARPEATEAELWRALEIAQASDFVQAMPDGINSTIEQGGANVSGGQRQRLSIARALVAQPSVYIFDDSFSALDLATEARLRADLAERTRDASVIMVAQRVSTIRDADQIVVLDRGEVVGIGTHDALFKECPTYQEIVDSQFDREGV